MSNIENSAESRRFPVFPLVLVGMSAGAWAKTGAEHLSGQKLINPDKEFEIVNIENGAVTLKQGDTQFTVKDVKVIEEVKRKILAQSPELKSYIESLDKDGVKVINKDAQSSEER